MKKFMCFLMIVVCFSCNNISSMAEEDFTLDIGNVHIDATIMDLQTMAGEVQIEYMNQINMHDAMAMNLAEHYDCAYELGFEGGNLQADPTDWSYSYIFDNGKRLSLNTGPLFDVSTIDSEYECLFADANNIIDYGMDTFEFALPQQGLEQGMEILHSMGLNIDLHARKSFSVNGEQFHAKIEELNAYYREIGNDTHYALEENYNPEAEIAYIIWVEQTVNGLPVSGAYRYGSRWRNTSYIVFTQQGIEHFHLDHPIANMEIGEAQPLISHEEAAAALAEDWNYLLNVYPLDIKEVRLCYVAQDPGTTSDLFTLEARLVPAWEFSSYSYAVGEENVLYINYYYVNAITGEVIL